MTTQPPEAVVERLAEVLLEQEELAVDVLDRLAGDPEAIAWLVDEVRRREAEAEGRPVHRLRAVLVVYAETLHDVDRAADSAGWRVQEAIQADHEDVSVTSSEGWVLRVQEVTPGMTTDRYFDELEAWALARREAKR